MNYSKVLLHNTAKIVKLRVNRGLFLCFSYLIVMGVSLSHDVAPSPQQSYAVARKGLIDELKGQGIKDTRVLEVMAKMPRELFMPEKERDQAYGNYPLGIGYDQTISQPYIVAFMTQELGIQERDKILEIGTGSGYQAAILAQLCPKGSVFTIEIVDPLAKQAAALLKEMKYLNVQVRSGNGYEGWPEEAPFDKIILTAAPGDVPPALLSQLKIGGKLIAPVGVREEGQELVLITRKGEADFQTQKLLAVRFVPMVSQSSFSKR